MARKRVTCRPGKANAVFGVIMGVIFAVIGVSIAIPSFGLFGVLWTLAGIGITAINVYQALGKPYTGPEIRVEDDAQKEDDAETRLLELRSLYDRSLITDREYEAKRQEILKDL